MSGKQTNANNGAVSPLRGGGAGDQTEGGRVVTDNAASAASAADASAGTTGAKGKIGGLSIYRMQLLGTEGLQRYRETGHIPDDLLD